MTVLERRIGLRLRGIFRVFRAKHPSSFQFLRFSCKSLAKSAARINSERVDGLFRLNSTETGGKFPKQGSPREFKAAIPNRLHGSSQVGGRQKRGMHGASREYFLIYSETICLLAEYVRGTAFERALRENILHILRIFLKGFFLPVRTGQTGEKMGLKGTRSGHWSYTRDYLAKRSSQQEPREEFR